MDTFKPKNPNLGKFWRALEWKIFVYSMAIWNIYGLFGIFYGELVSIWYIFPRFGILCQENLATLENRQNFGIHEIFGKPAPNRFAFCGIRVNRHAMSFANSFFFFGGGGLKTFPEYFFTQKSA
jgi:hypothetical protein